MTKLLILGANGQIAKLVVPMLANTLTEIKLTSLHGRPDKNIKSLDATNENTLAQALKDIDIVYANIGAEGRQKVVANSVVNAMHAAGVKRLIWIATIGVYDELPDKTRDIWSNVLGTVNNENTYIGDQAAAVARIEASQLDYTIIRPNELLDDNVMQQLNIQTDRHEKIVGNPVTRTSVAEFITKLILNPTDYIKQSVALSEK
ncbi:NAD(P)-dependent oxidoreductase [Leuconostoc carnosum]|uniref:NAD(P)H-binding protein n=1 Tax=Leuconostoc TaxID=1243 RepID=UPI000D516B73|nr:MULTISPECIES: NAD(P)H-binding protein [Leuconostoc]KAA8324839.1 NAD(P)-dependent oxidoreductase [Leuconostoc carnosum]KAA8358775.1 NAD(P)-dependent oxidoreductase [Leuconostoc carnosum]KAA8364945.1 NAD(P)-dependent oxidoreductase [Leuconostoc carnosum]KAA8366487.1 NAD(P)-dependent oxidoreductase [Leuconostoc carnosum]KAA8369775.1 NAD(P)-dependent oxidoreductase [Leuconostoc carnosum]